MEVRFYKITDTRTTINKTLGDYTSTFVNLKFLDCSVVNPTLRMKFLTYPDYNYIYIPAFKRYYFIDDISIETTNTFIIQLQVDVLETFKDDILAGIGHLIKSNTDENKYYNGDYKHLETYETHKFTSDYTLSDKEFTVLATLGGV